MLFLSAILQLRKNKFFLGSLLSLVFFSSLTGALATDYSSTNFTIKDPVIGGGGLDSTTTSFQVLSAIGQTGEGEGTSTNYELRSGVLYFAELATAPVITTTTAGEEQVTLAWSAASGNVAVDHYELGKATSSGAQTYSSIGSVLTTVVSGLTGGTTYYFTIRAVDATGSVTATSAEVSATPTEADTDGGGGFVPPPPPPDDGDPDDPVEDEETIPAAPTALSGEAINSSTVRWEFIDNSDNEDSFGIEVNGNEVASASANASFIDETVTPNTLHLGRKVFARNSAGKSGFSEFAGVHTPIESPVAIFAQTFGVPNALQLRAASSTSIFTNLSAGQSALEFINTTQNTSSGWVKTDNIIVSGLATGKPYSFIVRARNAVGEVTNYSVPFTFTLPTEADPGQDVPDQQAPPEDSTTSIDVGIEDNFALNIIYPENNSEITGDELEALVSTVPFAVVTLQINATTATGLADANGQARFTLRNLPSGRYLLTAIATAQSGIRSKAARLIFYVVTDSGGQPVTAEEPATIAPVAPITPPPPIVVQPPLTQAIIVSEVVVPKVSYLVCGAWCGWLAILIAIYIILLIIIWYLVWWYINRPFLTPTKKRRNKN